MNRKIFTFGAGPCIFPLEVLNRVKNNILNFKGLNISLFDLTKNNNHYHNIHNELKESLRNTLEIPNNFDILFLQGGATSQFSMVPLNLLKENEIGRYFITGTWSDKAFKEASKLKKGYSIYNWKENEKKNKIPLNIDNNEIENSKYLYYCDNETIQGVEFQNPPKVKNNYLVTDMTSNFLSKKIDFTDYGLIYAGAQKNFGPSGLSIVLIRKDLYTQNDDFPIAYNFWNAKNHDSKYINLPIFSMYFTKLYIDWMNEQGGLNKMNELSVEKSNILYDYIDNSNSFYKCPTEKSCRSRMNIPFLIKDDDKKLTELFLKESNNEGLLQLKGHRSVGGLRASLYNGMPIEGVLKLKKFMIDFKNKYK